MKSFIYLSFYWHLLITSSLEQSSLISIDSIVPIVPKLDESIAGNKLLNSVDRDPTGLATCTQTLPNLHDSPVTWNLHFDSMQYVAKVDIYVKAVPSTTVAEMSSLYVFVSAEHMETVACEKIIKFDDKNKITVVCNENVQFFQISLNKPNKALNICDVRFYKDNNSTQVPSNSSVDISGVLATPFSTIKPVTLDTNYQTTNATNKSGRLLWRYNLVTIVIVVASTITVDRY